MLTETLLDLATVGGEWVLWVFTQSGHRTGLSFPGSLADLPKTLSLFIRDIPASIPRSIRPSGGIGFQLFFLPHRLTLPRYIRYILTVTLLVDQDMRKTRSATALRLLPSGAQATGI